MPLTSSFFYELVGDLHEGSKLGGKLESVFILKNFFAQWSRS